MVELKETSDILLGATSKSFVVLDELGRGKSTQFCNPIELIKEPFQQEPRLRTGPPLLGQFSVGLLQPLALRSYN
jgi:hypothetical protein